MVQTFVMRLPARPPTTFCDGDLVLRVVSAEDWQLQQQLSGTEDVVRWTTIPEQLTEAAARARAERAHVRYGTVVAAEYVVERAAVCCGQVGIAALDHDVAEVFYALLPAARGRGTATRAIATLVQWAHGAGVRAVVLRTHPDNIASQRTAVRCGFVITGETVDLVKGVPRQLLRWSHVAEQAPGS